YNVPRGTAFLTSQQLILYATYLVFYALLARILNKVEVGQFAVLALIQALFVGVVSGSLPSAATRFISRSIAAGDLHAASGVARATLRLSLAVVVPAVVIALFLSPLLGGFLQGATDPTNLLLATFVSALFADLMLLSAPVFASALITLGQQWGDMGIVYALLGPIALGPYYLVVSSVSFLSILWIPVNQAIYPALSAAHSADDIQGVSDRLALAFRLINLSALPIGASLAAISPTALDIVYGRSYVSESLTMSILSLSSVLVAQGALL